MMAAHSVGRFFEIPESIKWGLLRIQCLKLLPTLNRGH